MSDFNLPMQRLTIQMRERNRILAEDTINTSYRDVKSPWPTKTEVRAFEIMKEIQMGVKHPFNEITLCHSANPQGMGQKSITFFRQVTIVCLNPNLLHSADYPSDVKQRASAILQELDGHSVGSYTDYRGLKIVRQQVAKYIEKRDGVPASSEDIFLSFAATEALMIILSLFRNYVSSKPIGIMIPVPEYPLFSAALTLYGIHQINYYLNEDRMWSVDIDELRRAVNESKSECEPKALAIVNPGNPSGYVMSREDIQNIIKFAYEENLYILADEVYQHNVYGSQEFHSFKKVMHEMGPPYTSMEIASVMSAAKGYMGESGSRSGYCEVLNMDEKVKDRMFKAMSLRISPPTLGQVMMYCICNPPQPDEPSYELFEKEKNFVIQSLKEKAQYCYERLNSVQGMICNKSDGGMFVFPRVFLSNKAVKESETRNLTPDDFYVIELVEETGICLMSGNDYGQKPQTYHFRLAFLHPMEELKTIVEQILKFHIRFMEKYAD